MLEHRFTYSLVSHPGDWAEVGVTSEAFALNSPLVAAVNEGTSSEYGFVAAEGVKLVLGCLKKAEDGRGVILRLYEPYGTRGPAALPFSSGVGAAERVNLLDEPERTVGVRSGEVLLDVRPFEVLTLHVEPKTG